MRINLGIYVYGGLTLLGYWLYIIPLKTTWRTLQQQNFKLAQVIQNTQLSIVKLENTAADVNNIKHNVLRLIQKQKYANSLPTLFNQLSQLAVQYGVFLDVWTPLAVIKHKHYVEYPVKLIIRGNYTHVYQSLLALLHMHFMHMGSTLVLERIVSKLSTVNQLRLTTQVSIERVLDDTQSQLTHKSTTNHAISDPFKMVMNNVTPHKTLHVIGVVIAQQQRWFLIRDINGIVKHIALGALLGNYRVAQITAHKIKLIQVHSKHKVKQNTKIIWLDVKAYA